MYAHPKILKLSCVSRNFRVSFLKMDTISTNEWLLNSTDFLQNNSLHFSLYYLSFIFFNQETQRELLFTQTVKSQIVCSMELL